MRSTDRESGGSKSGGRPIDDLITDVSILLYILKFLFSLLVLLPIQLVFWGIFYRLKGLIGSALQRIFGKSGKQ